MQTEKEPDDLTLKELIDVGQHLTANAVWNRLMLAVQGQADSLQSEIIFGEVVCEGDVYRMERRKGMLEGRLSLAVTLQGMLDSWRQDLLLKTGEKSDVDA
jgi:hypothetical protein